MAFPWMKEAVMPETEDTPIPSTLPVSNSGELAQNDETQRSSLLLRTTFGALLGVLAMGQVALYSLHKAMESRVESHERRIERSSKLLTDLLSSRDNAAKIEEIEQQVVGIEGQIGELVDMVRDNAEQSSPVVDEPKPSN
jgi:hypothetical protein